MYRNHVKKCSFRFHSVARHVKMFAFGSLMVLFVRPICHCIREVPDAIIKEMFLWMGLWQMNVSLQRQRKGLSHVSSFCVTQKDTPHTDMHRHTDSFYILEVFGVLVFQQWWWLVLRWGSDKRNQRGQHPSPLWFPLSALDLLKR